MKKSSDNRKEEKVATEIEIAINEFLLKLQKSNQSEIIAIKKLPGFMELLILERYLPKEETDYVLTLHVIELGTKLIKSRKSEEEDVISLTLIVNDAFGKEVIFGKNEKKDTSQAQISFNCENSLLAIKFPNFVIGKLLFISFFFQPRPVKRKKKIFRKISSKIFFIQICSSRRFKK